MLDHHLQRSIVYRLAFEPSLRFSELKPETAENKLFNYHLQKVIAAGLIAKRVDGSYALTPEGRRVGTRILNTQLLLANRAEAVLFLVVRRKSDSAWLLYKRLTHPLLGRVGFMHATPDYRYTSAEVARQTCLAKTGIAGRFEPLGSGFFHIYDQEQLESFTNFTLLVCEEAAGELSQNDPHAGYYWDTAPDFTSPHMLPNMQLLTSQYQVGKPFFVEADLRLN